MGRRRWVYGVGAVVCLGLASALVAREVTPAEQLSVAESESFLRDASTLGGLVHRGPAGPGLWSRRCTQVRREPRPSQRAALARVVAIVERRGDAAASLDGFDVEVRSRVRSSADDIALCRSKVSDVNGAWSEFEATLRQATD